MFGSVLCDSNIYLYYAHDDVLVYLCFTIYYIYYFTTFLIIISELYLKHYIRVSFKNTSNLIHYQLDIPLSGYVTQELTLPQSPKSLIRLGIIHNYTAFRDTRIWIRREHCRW